MAGTSAKNLKAYRQRQGARIDYYVSESVLSIIQHYQDRYSMTAGATIDALIRHAHKAISGNQAGAKP